MGRRAQLPGAQHHAAHEGRQPGVLLPLQTALCAAADDKRPLSRSAQSMHARMTCTAGAVLPLWHKAARTRWTRRSVQGSISRSHELGREGQGPRSKEHARQPALVHGRHQGTYLHVIIDFSRLACVLLFSCRQPIRLYCWPCARCSFSRSSTSSSAWPPSRSTKTASWLVITANCI